MLSAVLSRSAARARTLFTACTLTSKETHRNYVASAFHCPRLDVLIETELTSFLRLL
jgi:hypothetical protein